MLNWNATKEKSRRQVEDQAIAWARDGYGWEDIHVELRRLGYPINEAFCRLVVKQWGSHDARGEVPRRLGGNPGHAGAAGSRA